MSGIHNGVCTIKLWDTGTDTLTNHSTLEICLCFTPWVFYKKTKQKTFKDAVQSSLRHWQKFKWAAKFDAFGCRNSSCVFVWMAASDMAAYACSYGIINRCRESRGQTETAVPLFWPAVWSWMLCLWLWRLRICYIQDVPDWLTQCITDLIKSSPETMMRRRKGGYVALSLMLFNKATMHFVQNFRVRMQCPFCC